MEELYLHCTFPYQMKSCYSEDNNEWPNGYYTLFTLKWPSIVAHTVFVLYETSGPCLVSSKFNFLPTVRVIGHSFAASLSLSNGPPKESL